MVRARRSISDVSSLIVVDESDARALHDGVVLRVLGVHELGTAEEELHGGHRDVLARVQRRICQRGWGLEPPLPWLSLWSPPQPLLNFSVIGGGKGGAWTLS